MMPMAETNRSQEFSDHTRQPIGTWKNELVFWWDNLFGPRSLSKSLSVPGYFPDSWANNEYYDSLGPQVAYPNL